MNKSNGFTFRWNVRVLLKILNKTEQFAVITLAVLTFSYNCQAVELRPSIFICSDDIIPPAPSNRTDIFHWGGPTELGQDNQDLSFLKTMRKLECEPNQILKVFYWHEPRSASRAALDEAIGGVNKRPLSNMTLTSDGTLLWNKAELERYVYKKKDYCIFKDHVDGWITFHVCSDHCSNSIEHQTPPCIRKCCLPSQHVREESNGRYCVARRNDSQAGHDSDEEDDDIDNSSLDNAIQGVRVSAILKAPSLFGFPQCANPKLIPLLHNPYMESFTFLENGALTYTLKSRRRHPGKQMKLDIGDYCIDEGNTWYSKHLQLVLLGCSDKATQATEKIHEWHTGTFFWCLNLVSTTLLAVTCVVCIVLLCKGHFRLQNWFQLAYAITIFIPFALCAHIHAWPQFPPRWFCLFHAWPTVFIYFSSFFWLTSMSFDLWWRISSTLENANLKLEEWKRFVVSAIVSISVPLVISGNAIHPDQLFDHDEEWCFADLRLFRVTVLFGTAWAVIFINLLFVASTMLHLWKMRENEEIQARHSFKEDKMNFSIYTKMFIMTGILLFSELAFAVLCQINDYMNVDLILWLFSPLDVLRGLQGVIVFKVFVCNPSVVKKLVCNNCLRNQPSDPENEVATIEM